MRHGMRLTRAAALLVGLGMIGVSGCGDDGTSPEGEGFAQAIVSDNPNSTTPQAYPALHIAGSSGSSQYTGTISGNFSVAVSADGTVWHNLGSPNGITVQAQSTTNTTNVHGEVTIPAGTYARVRLTMSNARATVDAGGQIGGITLDADIEVTVAAGGEVVIEKQVQPFTVSGDASVRTEILFDLNSELWLTEQNAQDGDASGEEVDSATESRTRESARTQPQ